MTDHADATQPHIVDLDDGGVQIDWRTRGFEIEIVLNADDELEGVYIHDLESGFKVDKDV